MNREDSLFADILKKHKKSHTAPRNLLFYSLKSHNACTIAQLTSLLCQYDRATVYRTIALFEKLGIINRVYSGWKYKLELSDMFHHHHHHMTCTNCSRVYVLKEDQQIENHIALMAKRAQFKTTDHQLEMRGLCIKCQKT